MLLEYIYIYFVSSSYISTVKPFSSIYTKCTNKKMISQSIKFLITSSGKGGITNSVWNYFISRTNNIIRRSNGERWGEHQVPKVGVLVDVVERHHIVQAKQEVAGIGYPLMMLFL